MKKTTLQFKCDLCGSIVSDIPYCGECETVLSNFTRINDIVEKIIYNKPGKKIIAVDPDADLFNDYDNRKAASIQKIIYSGIRRKKKKSSRKDSNLQFMIRSQAVYSISLQDE